MTVTTSESYPLAYKVDLYVKELNDYFNLLPFSLVRKMNYQKGMYFLFESAMNLFKIVDPISFDFNVVSTAYLY